MRENEKKLAKHNSTGNICKILLEQNYKKSDDIKNDDI